MNKKILLLGLVFLLLLSSAFAVGTAPDPADTVGYYTFDENAGTNAEDSVTSTNDPITSASWGTGILNSDLDFGTLSDNYYVDIGGESVFNYIQNTGVFSMSFWVYTDSTSTQYIMGNSNSGSTKGFYVAIVSSKMRFVLTNGASGSATFTSDSSISANTWQHIVITGDGTNIDFYIDGVHDTSAGTYTITKPTGDSTNELTIGKMSTYAVVTLGGEMDEVLFADVTYGQDEVDFLYQSGSPTSAQQYPFTVPPSSSDTLTVQVKDADTLANVNNVTVLWSGTNYTNVTGNIVSINITAEGGNISLNQNFTVYSQNYFDVDVTNWNLTNNYQANLTQYPYITAHNVYDNTTITTFNATIDATTYQTTNGFIYLPLNSSKTVLIESSTYFSNTTTHNFVSQANLNASLYQSIINFNPVEIITNNTAVGNITINAETKTSDQTWYLSAGDYNATFSGSTYFDRTIEFSVAALDNKTVDITGISGSVLNLTFREFFTNDLKTGVTGYYTNNEYNVNESFNTGANSYIELGVVQGLNFNVTIDDPNFAITTEEFYVNSSTQNETVFLYIINSVNIFIRDEITNALLDNTTFALEFVGTAGAFNASTSNGTYYAELITPDDYQIRYYSTSNSLYNLRSYTFTLTNQSFNEITLYAIENNQTLSTVAFNVFSTDLEPVEGATIILERYYIAEDGYSQVSSGLTNVDGRYVDFVQPIDAFYRYKVLVDGVVKYASPSTGTQFAQDTNLNIYIDLGGNTYNDYQNIFNIPTTISYVAITNYTGYFEFSYTNPNLIPLCFEVVLNTTTSETCPTVTTSGTVQISVNATENVRSVAIASAKAYNNDLGEYVVYSQTSKTFFPSSSFTQNYNDIFNLGLSIIFTIIALVFIRLPIVSVVVQSFILVLFALLPLPFYTISIVTIGWIIGFNIVILWITKKEGVNQ